MLGTLAGLIVLIFALVLYFDPEARTPSKANLPLKHRSGSTDDKARTDV